VKAQIGPAIKAHLVRGAFYLLLLLAICVIPFSLGQRQATEPSLKNNPTIVCNDTWQAGPDMPSTGVRMVGVYFPVPPKFYAMGGRSMDGIGNDFAQKAFPFEKWSS
jgi:hypothetical protein